MFKAQRLKANRGRALQFTFEGTTVTAYDGETVATALLAAGVTAFNVTRGGEPRMPFCNMGTCFDCAVCVNGHSLVRACLTDVSSGMQVNRQEGK
ncbi:sarcosine oxidase subunit alpha [Celeribacter baekdonensis]|jgi:predicted molibdopterin-dependent oxidoreductase YjgC|uniref:Sarcosine oxidase subunit alpha n=1 Tax=Celeribacter baekdonensis TaxID=875171 RepID=A0A1G7NYL5_9RHOB|nr:(2Fe-2S)-binding protein [Celeribacter baekdonensis]SDF78459.1 sarcosine oxidase subunit alpha [Celeribacter baekdonensis]